MSKTPRLTLKISAIALMLCLVVTANVQALTITPIRYEITGEKGEILKEKMSLVNETDKTQTLYASFANFEAQGDTGSPSFVDSKDGLATWITTDQASVTLSPGAQKEISFKINIPKDAEVGGHFAAIFWGTSPGAGQRQVSIGTKTGMLILLSVKGDVKQEAGLLDFGLHNNKHFYKQLPIGFQYRFSNQGGDRVKPKGNVVIRSIFGWVVKKVNANPYDGNVLPSTTRKFSTQWSKRDSVETVDQENNTKQSYSFKQSLNDEWNNFAFGIFRAKVVTNFGSLETPIKSKALYFVVFPWELILVAVILTLLLFFILKIMIKKYNKSIIAKAQKDINLK
jgi:hypothetical protein